MAGPVVDWREVYKDASEDSLNKSIQLMARALTGAMEAAMDDGLMVEVPTWTKPSTGPSQLVMTPPRLARMLET